LELITAESIAELLHYESNDIKRLKMAETLPTADSPPHKNVFYINQDNPIW
jgi:hypothetical protein